MRETYRERRKRRKRKSNGSIRITIPGDPIPQRRPRACKRGNHAAVYSTQQKERDVFKVYALEQYQGEPLDGPLEAMLFFHFTRPKAHYGTGKNAGKLKGSAPKMHQKKPDVDNLAKFCLDACNGILFVDDSQISSMSAFKRYVDFGEGAETIISVRAL